jgi:hypothetical protein
MKNDILILVNHQTTYLFFYKECRVFMAPGRKYRYTKILQQHGSSLPLLCQLHIILNYNMKYYIFLTYLI